MPVIPPIATENTDIAQCQRRAIPDVSNPTNSPLFDHRVGAAEQGNWQHETERLRGLQIDDEFDFRGLLHQQLAWFLALQESSGVKAADAALAWVASDIVSTNSDCCTGLLFPTA